MTDVFGGVTTEFANDLLKSQTYPFLLTFQGKGQRRPTDEVQVRIDDVDQADDEVAAAAAGDEILDVSVESFVDSIVERNKPSRRTAPSPEEDELYRMFAKPVGDETITLPSNQEKRILDLTGADVKALEAAGDSRSINGLGKLFKKIKGALSSVWNSFKKEFQKFIKKYFRFTVLWTKAEIQSPPLAKAASSIELKNLDVYVQIQIEACIKIKSWKCAKITSPRVHLKSPSFFYDLSVSDRKVVGKPRAGEMSLQIDVTIFGFSFRITIGVTKFINGILEQQKPSTLFDFSKVEMKIDMFKRKFVFSDVQLRNGNDYLEALVDGTFVPLT